MNPIKSTWNVSPYSLPYQSITWKTRLPLQYWRSMQPPKQSSSLKTPKTLIYTSRSFILRCHPWCWPLFKIGVGLAIKYSLIIKFMAILWWNDWHPVIVFYFSLLIKWWYIYESLYHIWSNKKLKHWVTLEKIKENLSISL